MGAGAKSAEKYRSGSAARTETARVGEAASFSKMKDRRIVAGGSFRSRQLAIIQMGCRRHAEQHGDGKQRIDAAEHGWRSWPRQPWRPHQSRKFAPDVQRPLLIGPDHEPDIEPHNSTQPHADADRRARRHRPARRALAEVEAIGLDQIAFRRARTMPNRTVPIAP